MSEEPECCPTKPDLDDRPPLSSRQATELENLFKTLANGNRLRILHVLIKNGRESVGNIASEIEGSDQAVSNQLRLMEAQGYVESRRDGNHRFYRIKDPCIPALIDRGLCLLEEEGVLGGGTGSIEREQGN